MSRTILILSATPRDTTPLRVDEEVREIEDAIRRSQYRNEFRVIPRLAVRARDVQRALLEHRPTIIHFSGHGRDEQGVVLEDDHGHPLLVGSEALADFFGVVTKWHAIECVLLNACHSQTQIREMAQHVSYVIGMREALDDRAGIAFARAFYEGLGNGASIPDAHDMACSTVSMSGLCADRIAVLASRTGTARASDNGTCELLDPAGSRAATSKHAFARDLLSSSGQGGVRRATRWITMAATPLLCTLLVHVLGQQVHRARELVIGTSGIEFSYDTAELLETGMVAGMGLLRSMATGLLVGLGIERWAVLILIAICTATMLLARSGRLRLCTLWLSMLLPILAFGSLFLAQAASAHHVAIPAENDWPCQPGPGIPQQIRFEVCSWLTNPSKINEGRRVALAGLTGWLALTLGVVTWTAGRIARNLCGSRVWSRTAIGMALTHGLLCLLVLAQIPRTQAMARWGLRYPRVVQLDSTCTPDLADAVRDAECHAVDVSAGATSEILVYWGEGCSPLPSIATGAAHGVPLRRQPETGERCIQQIHGLQTILGGDE